MTLTDLRKIAIRKQLKIRFRLANGMDCVVNEHGVAQVPGLQSAPDFNLETELAAAGQFTLETVPAADSKIPSKSSQASRDELAGLMDRRATATAHDDHDDE